MIKNPKIIRCLTYIWILIILSQVQSQTDDSISLEDFMNKANVSSAILRGKISTIIPHPIDSTIKIYRIKVSKFLKGCGDKTINLNISNNDVDISKFKGTEVNSSGFKSKIEIIIFVCPRDENGISWELSKGMGGVPVFKWNFLEHYKFEKNLENLQGCLECCSSSGECANSFEEAEELKEKNQRIKDRNNKNKTEILGNLLKDFNLGKNKQGANFFFNQ